ncbi:hypothetical protein GmHk_08G023416 [Glycine max]|nr:hypothetical protein GmHk_08G023416 [Glycine max]
MFVDYVNETWIILHKEKFVTAWTNKTMHLENTTTNIVLQNSLGDLCSVRDAMNNTLKLKHPLKQRLLGMISRYALNQIVAEYKHNPSHCECVMRTTHGLPCACELSKYVLGRIPLDSIHMFWRRLSFLDQGLSEPQVTIKKEMKTISK